MNLNAVTWTLTLLIVGLAKIYSDPSSSWLCSRFTLRGPQVAAPHGAGFNCQTKCYKIWLIRVGAARALIPEARDVFILQNAEDAYRLSRIFLVYNDSEA